MDMYACNQMNYIKNKYINEVFEYHTAFRVTVCIL